MTDVLPLQACPHCQTVLRFKAGYAIDEGTRCPECGEFLLKTSQAKKETPKKTKDQASRKKRAVEPVDDAVPKGVVPGQLKAPGASFLKSRFVVFFLLSLAATLFFMIAVLKPALDAHSKATLHALKSLNEEEPVVVVTPVKEEKREPETIVVETMPEEGDVEKVVPMKEEGPVVAEVPSSNGPREKVLIETPPAPPMPAQLTRGEKLESALMIPVMRYAIDSPVTLQELLYDFEEMLACSIQTEGLSDKQKEKLTEAVSPFELKETSLKGVLDRLLGDAGLEFAATSEGDLVVRGK